MALAPSVCGRRAPSFSGFRSPASSPLANFGCPRGPPHRCQEADPEGATGLKQGKQPGTWEGGPGPVPCRSHPTLGLGFSICEVRTPS